MGRRRLQRYARFRRALRRVEARLVPPAIRAGAADGKQRARVLLASAAVLAVLGPIFALLCRVLGPPGFAPALLAATAAACAVPALLRRTGSLLAGGLALVSAYFLVLVWGASVSGGLNTPALWWLVGAPMLASTILGRGWGAVTAGLAATCYLAFFALVARGVLPRHAQPDAVGSVNVLTTQLGLAFVVWSLLLISETSREDAERSRARANRRLRDEVARRRRAQAEVERLARYDALTQLPNRRTFEETLAKAFDRAREGGEPFAMLMLDLDRFKEVNDTLGHPAGDELLARVAERLAGGVRPEDLTARLGGDEFAILIRGRGLDPARAAAVAARLLAALAEPFKLRSSDVRSGASIGVALFSPEVCDASELVRRADDALYAAKRAGRGRWRIYAGPGPAQDAPPPRGDKLAADAA